jgi:SagB-type dehydrogenase family enzyme
MADPSAAPELTLALMGARTEEHEGALVVVLPRGRLSLATESPGVHAALLRLASGGGTESALSQLVREHGDASELAALFYYLRIFDAAGQLSRSVEHEGARLLSLVPQRTSYHFELAALADDEALVLSRFAYLRRFDEGLVLESPASFDRVRVHDPRVTALIHALTQPAGLSLAQLDGELPRPQVRLLLRMLLATGHLLRRADPREEQPPMATWSFHDLAFHARSRVGRHDQICGKTYPFLGKLEPLPALKPTPEGARVELPTPARPKGEDRRFTEILDARRSVREQGEAPITLAQIAEFLHRAAQVRSFAPAAPPVHYEVTNRPSPGGGGCHELELYLAVDRCEGLASGLYHYHPRDHFLTRISERTPELELLLADTKIATAGPAVSQVLVCIAARFARMAWPYEGIPYATTLKNTGALLQTMYLVATAMGLAPCAIGRGNSDIFAELAGTNYYAETTVGEFLLGSHPSTDT